MDSVDGLLPIGFGLLCIFLINFFVVAKFSFARLRKEHVEDMDILLEKDREFLFLIRKKAVCCRMVQGGLELRCRSDG